MNDLRNRERLRRALDLIDQVSAEHQAALNDRAAATLEQNPGPIGVGRMLAISRRTDALDRIGREIVELLDYRPPSPAMVPRRPNGPRLREALEQAKASGAISGRREAADRLGMSAAQLSKLENGHKPLPEKELKRCLNLLETF